MIAKTGFPNPLGLIPRFLFYCGMIIFFWTFPKAFIFSISSIVNDFVSFPLFKKKKRKFNYLKIKLLFCQSIPAVLIALTYQNAINYMKELFIILLNTSLIFLGSLLG